MIDFLSVPMYLVPITDPDRIRELNEKFGITPEETERKKKAFREQLEAYYQKHPDKRPKQYSKTGKTQF